MAHLYMCMHIYVFSIYIYVYNTKGLNPKSHTLIPGRKSYTPKAP